MIKYKQYDTTKIKYQARHLGDSCVVVYIMELKLIKIGKRFGRTDIYVYKKSSTCKIRRNNIDRRTFVR